jgi:hypothetical protein
MQFIDLFILLSLMINATLAVTKLSNCKAQLDDGKIIDLTSLDNANSPR